MASMLGVFANRRMATVLFLGFASGLPLYLTGATLQAWLTDAKIDLPTIGRFSLVGLPYTVKFLWSPFLDSYAPPWLGRRRGWALLSQLGIALALAVMAFLNPAQNLLVFAVVALVIAFCSATQDIVLDAYRTEILRPEELGAGAGVYIMGYRLAMLVSGAVALGMADHLPWRVVYLSMIAVLSVGAVAVWVSPEPDVPLPVVTRFSERVIAPFADFFRRQGAMEILLFVMVYKLSTMMATSLTTTFLMSLTFSKTEIGAVSKVFGLLSTIVGTLAGGALMTRLGMKRSLWIFGVLQAVGGLSFILLAELGRNHFAMIGVITTENFLIGMGLAAISGFMMQVCSRQFTGTQFALLSSLTAVSRVVLVSQAGNLAQWLGWPGFFMFSVTLAAPGLLLLLNYDRWQLLPAADALRRSVKDQIAIAGFVIGLVLIASEPIWTAMLTPLAGAIAAGAGAAVVGLVALMGLADSWRRRKFELRSS
jgi:PAT family beta-lactamase induction signal transducer AmpG